MKKNKNLIFICVLLFVVLFLLFLQNRQHFEPVPISSKIELEDNLTNKNENENKFITPKNGQEENTHQTLKTDNPATVSNESLQSDYNNTIIQEKMTNHDQVPKIEEESISSGQEPLPDYNTPTPSKESEDEIYQVTEIEKPSNLPNESSQGNIIKEKELITDTNQIPDVHNTPVIPEKLAKADENKSSTSQEEPKTDIHLTPEINIPVAPNQFIQHEINNGFNEQSSIIFVLFGTKERLNERTANDAIMLVKYIPQDKKAILISVPEIDMTEKQEKTAEIQGDTGGIINRPKAELKVLEDLFEIKVDYYAIVSYNGFIKIVDTLDGVRINVNQAFVKQNPGNTNSIKRVQMTLDGKKALDYVRFKEAKGGELNRMKRQQEVIISLAKKVIKPVNIPKIPSLVDIIKNNIQSDINWTELIKLVWQLKNINTIKIEQYTLETYTKDRIHVIKNKLDDRPTYSVTSNE